MKTLFLLLFTLAMVRYWVHDTMEVVPHYGESILIARNIAEHGQFANPFVPLDTGPSAQLAPAFPAFLAIFIRLLGDGALSLYGIKLAAAVTVSLTLALFPVFSKELGMGMWTGVIATLVWIMAKVGLYGDVALYGWEAFYVALLLAIVACSYRHYLKCKSTFWFGCRPLVGAFCCLVLQPLASSSWEVLSYFFGKRTGPFLADPRSFS